MHVIKNKKIYISISAFLVAVCIFFMASWGLPFGIDFTGGSLLEVSYEDTRPSVEEIESTLSSMELTSLRVQPTGENGVIIRTRSLSESEHGELKSLLAGAKEERFTSIGPVIGEELKNKAYVAIAIVAILILLFVAWAFRKSNEQMSSFKYGIVTIITLLHDIIIPTGLFVIFAHLYGGFEINALFVTALLAILGYSVNDTIVVFDRVRENVIANKERRLGKTFDEIVGLSLSQTIVRSINTSLTTFFVLLALFLFGGDATKEFTLVLMLGVISGTYSSIFLASPLLTVFAKNKK